MATAISGKGLLDIAGRHGVAVPGVESHFNNNVTRAYLDRLYPGYTEVEATASFSFTKGGIVLAGFYYLQGTNDVQAAIDNCSNAGSASGTLSCMNKVITAIIGHGMAVIAGGTSPATVTEMLSHVSTYAPGLLTPPKRRSELAERRTCPARSYPWYTPGNLDFNNGWATTATIVPACREVTWTRAQQAYAEELAPSLSIDMEFVGGSKVQLTVYDSQNDKALIRSNLVVINGGDLCTAPVTGSGCDF